MYVRNEVGHSWTISSSHCDVWGGSPGIFTDWGLESCEGIFIYMSGVDVSCRLRALLGFLARTPYVVSPCGRGFPATCDWVPRTNVPREKEC